MYFGLKNAEVQDGDQTSGLPLRRFIIGNIIISLSRWILIDLNK